MAIVSEIAFLSLISIRFKNRVDWFRAGAFGFFFLYFVGALSSHVLTESRAQLEASLTKSTTVDKGLIAEKLKSVRETLRIAEKGRSWKNMEVFGAQVTRLHSLILAKPQERALGFSTEVVVWIQIILSE